MRRIPSVRRVLEVAGQLRQIATWGERLERQLEYLNVRLDALSSKVEGGDELALALADAKASDEYAAVYERPAPLVTVVVATYNRAELVSTRAVPSLLAQDYKNLQILVVGDGCTDETATRLASLRDSRVHYTNLRERGRYPEETHARWMVAGSAAMNEGLRLAEGDFVTHLDDDDEHLPDRVSRLLALLRSTRADLAYHPFWAERADGWQLVAADGFRRKAVCTGSIFYHRWLKRISWDIEAYRLVEPGDWNRLRKIAYLGAKVEREPTPLLRHYRERAQGKSQ